MNPEGEKGQIVSTTPVPRRGRRQPQLQPGQGKPILGDCQFKNPAGEAVQDDGANF